MPLTERENFRKNASLQGHEWIPMHVAISGAMWHEGREELEDILLRHPVLFPGFEKGKKDFGSGTIPPEDRKKDDPWGCSWEYEIAGYAGIVTGHPLADWDAMATWQAPEPPAFGDEERKRIRERQAAGKIASCGTEHGFFFMRLYYLRGYENFMMDVALEDPRLDALADIVATYWERTLRPHADAGVDVLNAADDLGTETASMLGPAHFRRWLLPSYKRIFQPFRDAGAHVFMHHDGYIMDIMDDIIASGVNIVNPQDLVNGIDNIAEACKGRVCIHVDIDRQRIVPFGSPGDVHDLIREEVMKLGSPRGGLEMVVGIYPPTPLANIDALLTAMETYRTYWIGS